MTIEQRVLKEYGTTWNPVLAVWMLRDGTYVNGSIEGFRRDRDHHEINAFFKSSKRQTPGSNGIYVTKFMNRGNIRVGCSEAGYCFEFTKTPSQEQLDRICEEIRNGLEVCVARPVKRRTEWQTGWRFLEYVARYANRLYVPADIQERYMDYTGKALYKYE